jgi:histidinol-phosphate aminotransferase
VSYQAPGAGAALRLHYNENTAGCSPRVLEALASMTRMDIGAYPDVGPITDKTARYLGTDSSRVLVTNGLDEGIQATATWAARAVAGTTRRPEVIVVEPAFEMYAAFASMVGARVVALDPEPDFAFPLDALRRAVSAHTRVVFLTDPNNPTGLGLPAGVATLVAEAAPQALVFVDEAYADFSGRTLIGPSLDAYPNLIVGRTFAKGHGLAGLRIGAVIGHPATIGTLRGLVPPFSVNSAAIRALEVALDDRAYLEWYVQESVMSRELVYAFCRRVGLTYWPSEGNFVLLRLGEETASVVAELEHRGISLRDKSAAPGCAGCIRFTAGVVAHTVQALQALEDCLAARTH